jgi:prophage regulatory protein
MSELPSPPLASEGRRLIRRAEVQRRIPFSMVHIWRLEKARQFPRRLSIGPNAVAWFADEVDQWIESRIRAPGRVPKRREAADSSGKLGIADEPPKPRLYRGPLAGLRSWEPRNDDPEMARG